MKLRIWFLFALMLLVLPFTAVARDKCVCQPDVTYYHSSYSQPSYAWSAPIYVEIGPSYSTYQSSMWDRRLSNYAWSGNVSSSYRSSRSERRSHGGSRLSGHSTDHWSQQLNWGRP